MLADILVQVALVHLHAHGLHAPDMLAAPVPSFPAVGLARLQRVTAHEVEHHGLAAMGCMDDLRLAMAVGLAEDGKRAILVVNALDLVRDDLRCLIPADADVLRFAAVLRVALAMRIPVHAAHRVKDTVLGVDALFVA